MRASALAASLLCLLAAAPAVSADSTGKSLELGQIFGPSAVALDRRPQVKWLAGAEAYSTLEPSKTTDGAFDVVKYDSASGKRSVVMGAERLAVTEHDWSPDFRWLLLKDPPGDYWLFHPESKALQRIGRVLYPTFSPDSSRIAYVAANNLHVQAIEGTRTVQLTNDGSDLVLNGRADLAYAEEFSLSKAFIWSPDSRRIAYWQFDTTEVGTFYMIRNTDGQYSKPVPLRYPKPGTVNSAVRVGVVSADTPGTTWLALSGDARDNYVPRMDWAPNSKELLIQYENRLQNTNRVLLTDASTGQVRQVMVEQDEAWLIPNEKVVWLDGGRSFTWLSERDGWMHLYVISRDGKQVELRTPGNFDVISIEAIDGTAGHAWFIASPEDPTRRYLYRASLKGAVKVERLTPLSEVGWHEYDIAPGGGWAVHTFSTIDSPPVIDVVRVATHERKRLVTDNSGMRSLVQDTRRIQTEFFKVDIGPTQLDAWMIKPPGFDPDNKYPLLMYVYSEPAGQTVADRWGGDRQLWHWMLAQKGYLIASVDSRGAAAPRGREWRRSIYRQIGIQASADQAAAIRKMLADRPYIDAQRIGVWGWSGGGAMTLNAMFRYPELYATGIAIASPVDQMLYNSIYQERYMGLPAQNPQGYRDGSPINFAQNLRGNLLIIHGTGDDNVHYQNAEQLVDRLIALNKRFSMMAYPDRTHGIGEGAGTRLHLFDLATRFLEEHLPLD